MDNLNIDLNDLFGQMTAQRGIHYFKQKKVFYVELNEQDRLIKGTVSGSGGKIYHTEISLGSHDDDPDEDPLSSICGCPMAFNCKHVCALLLAAEQKYGDERLNELIDIAQNEAINPVDLMNILNQKAGKKIKDSLQKMTRNYNTLTISEDGSVSSSAQKKAKKSKLEKQRKDWLTRLKKASRDKSQSTETSLTGTKSGANCVVYILEQDYSGNMVAKIYLSRYLKRGGFGKPNIYRNAYNCIYQNNWPASMTDTDQHIVKLAYLHRALHEYYGEIRLNGVHGAELLHKILDTGRCVIDSNQMIPVISAKKLKGEVRWILNEEGFQRPALYDAESLERINLLTTEPASYLKVSTEQAECGELNNVPDVEVLNTLLEAPPLDEQGVEETAKALPSLIKGKGKKFIQLPKVVQILKIKPKPVLVLNAVQPDAFKTTEKAPIARAQLYFKYRNQRVMHNDPAESLTAEDNELQVIPRQYQNENQFIHQLPFNMKPVPLSLSDSKQTKPTELKDHDLIMGLSGSDYRRDWLHFMSEELPELEDSGWIIETHDDFPFQFEPLSDDDWYAELDESEMNWFTLKLGINIDGKSIDLLPLLARQIKQLPTPEELQKIPKDALIPIALPGGRFVNLPAERIQLIAGTLLELFGDRPLEEYRLQNHHAELWQELYDQLGLPWAGGEKLLELSRKLKSFKRLKKIKPAKQLQAELRPYQQHGLSWLQFLREYGLNGILADDMGLGKTLQTLAHLQLEKKRLGKALPPSMVICPTSLIHNWKNEARRFTPDLNIHVHHGSQRDSDAINNADLILTSYGVIQRDFDQLSQKQFHLLALDEAQAVKNPNSKGAKAIRCLRADHKLCITGTPMENHLGELWSLYDFLMPGFLGSRDQFTRCYRTPIEKHANKTQSKKLQKRVAPFMLRRSKDLVAKELPPKTEIIRTTELDGKQRDLYETIRASMEARVKDEIEKKGLARSQIVILDALLKMRQACCDP
ncbi:hypothetical protein ACH42_14655 [Endozoicomonas sp. (ex Bugula neritina AB1)]|nr:hypothetical protein ACH42_14655 [Endozoicomonas sp. (ex Bugula neritina AB1)]